MNKSTIKDFFKNQFRTDIDKMPIMSPLNVSEAEIGILGYNFKTKKDELTKVNYIVKKVKDKLIKIKTQNCEEEVGYSHLFYNGKAFQKVHEFHIGDQIQTKFGIENVLELEEIGEDFIYDVETELHNFYSNGILSHNTFGAHLPAVSGGESVKFYSSTVNRVTKTDVIKDGNDTIGISMRVRNYKNKCGIPFRDANINLYYKGGFNPNEEYIQFIVDLGIVQQKGAYFKSDEFGFSLQGRVKLQEWLDSHPDEYTRLKKQVDESLTRATILDAENEAISEDVDRDKLSQEIPDEILEETND
jgi:hypothetical protein